MYEKFISFYMDHSFDGFFGDNIPLVTVISKNIFSFKIHMCKAWACQLIAASSSICFTFSLT